MHMAQTPPPFSPQEYAPKRQSSPWLWILVGVVGFCVIGIVAVVALGFGAMRMASDIGRCIITTGAVASSLDDYVKAKGVFPPAETWQDDLAPFYKKQTDEMRKEMAKNPVGEMFTPAEITAGLECNPGGPKTYLAYNPAVAGKKPSEITDPGKTVVIFEQLNGGMNISAPYKAQDPANAPRVGGDSRGWFVMFADFRGIWEGSKSRSTTGMDMREVVPDTGSGRSVTIDLDPAAPATPPVPAAPSGN